MLHTLLEAVKFAGSLPNVDFVVNTGDHPLVDLPGKTDGGDGRGERARSRGFEAAPVFSIATSVGHADLPWPCFSFWDWRQAGIGAWPRQARRLAAAATAYPWNSRLPQAFWRGSDNGKFVDKAGVVQGKRRPLVALSQALPEEVNAQFTRSTTPLTQVSLQDHCRYKYLVNVAGASYSARLKYLLLCGSAVLQVSVPQCKLASISHAMQASKHQPCNAS